MLRQVEGLQTAYHAPKSSVRSTHTSIWTFVVHIVCIAEDFHSQRNRVRLEGGWSFSPQANLCLTSHRKPRGYVWRSVWSPCLEAWRLCHQDHQNPRLSKIDWSGHSFKTWTTSRSVCILDSSKISVILIPEVNMSTVQLPRFWTSSAQRPPLPAWLISCAPQQQKKKTPNTESHWKFHHSWCWMMLIVKIELNEESFYYPLENQWEC